MFKKLSALVVAALAGCVAEAHFVFVVPDATGKKAIVVLSEDLNPDEAVTVDKVAAGLKLQCRDASGKDVPLACKDGKHSLTTEVPGDGARLVFGSVTYGVMQRGESPAYLLIYHPKAVVGSVAADKLSLGEKHPAEIVPAAEGGKVKFRVLAAGKPVEGVEVNVILPDGKTTKVKTNPEGYTTAVEGKGRFGAWTRVPEKKEGEHGGKKYVEVRHYPTLVVDVPAK